MSKRRMNFKINFRTFSMLLLINASFGAQSNSEYRKEIIQNTDFIEEESYFACTCHGQSRRIDITKSDRLMVYEQLRNPGYCKLNDKKEICTMYRKCHNCSFHMTECQPNAMNHNKFDCQKKSFIITKKIGYHFSNGSSTNPRLHKREVRFCPLPGNSDTYDLICRKYTSHVRCNQICVFGYTLKKGTSGRRRCSYKDNKWKPVDFQECRPFVDCGMTLILPGKLNCLTATTDRFPICSVSCDAFEGKSATPMETFECRVTGTWGKELPFCVIPKTSIGGDLMKGLELVPPPKINLYPLLDDLLTFGDAPNFI